MPKATNNPLQKYAGDFLSFALDLPVPLGAGVGPLREHGAEHQIEDFKAIAPNIEALARGDIAKVRRFWVERTKGGSKDSDCALVILWLLAFAPRSIRVQVGAYDREQASELRFILKAMLAIDAPLNRLLAEVVEVQQYKIVAHNERSVCEILTSDQFGSHGARPSLLLCNELTHVQSEAFMQTLMDNADKCPDSVVIIATNSGEVGSWQERWKTIARESPRWHVSVLNRPAPWVSEADLEESRRRNPPHRFNRLWRGIWSSGEGDSLSPADIAVCTTLLGPQRPRKDRIYVAALDLGLKHDHSALAITAVDPVARIVELANVISWRPEDYEGTVDLEVVKYQVAAAHRIYGFHCCGFDPWQAHLLAQQLAREEQVPMREWPFVPKNKDLMARALLSGFADRKFAIYKDEQFERDLLRLKIKEGPVGYRLDAIRDDSGHADRAIAFAICAPAALYLACEWQPVPETREEVLVA